jgi:hypothetical protein
MSVEGTMGEILLLDPFLFFAGKWFEMFESLRMFPLAKKKLRPPRRGPSFENHDQFLRFRFERF